LLQRIGHRFGRRIDGVRERHEQKKYRRQRRQVSVAGEAESERTAGGLLGHRQSISRADMGAPSSRG